jgi:competence protein ComEA
MRLYLSRPEQYAVAVLLVAILAALFVLSYAYGRKQREAESQPFLVEGTASPGADAGGSVTTQAQLVVHVAGAVKAPGVYTFAAGARVIDAVQRAGGAREDGYPDALNLAEKLVDAERVYVPTRAEWQQMGADQGAPPLVTGGPPGPRARPKAVPAPGAAARPAGGTDPAGQWGPKPLPAAKVHLNTASVAQLMTLPGVGPVTAQRIVDYRKAHGPFADLAQLLDIPGIGPKNYERISPYVAL